MKQRRCKHKIITKNKSYSLKDSIFYKLSSKKRLAKILNSNIPDIKSLCADSNYRFFSKNLGTKMREIQTPLPQLDRLQSRVASLLCRIEASDYLHSGVKKRSNISNAKEHLGKNLKLITVDIEQFFTSTKKIDVFNFFYKTMLCSPDISDLLSKLLTVNGHIPTGSRISMPLAYFSNKKMFDEMQYESIQIGAKMTVFVDDITFSGVNIRKNFIYTISNICGKYGKKIHKHKIRFYNSKEIKLVTGVALIEDKAVPRNAHLSLLHSDMQEWINSDQAVNHSLENRILGRMSFIGSIDAKYKIKSKTFRRSIKP